MRVVFLNQRFHSSRGACVHVWLIPALHVVLGLYGVTHWGQSQLSDRATSREPAVVRVRVHVFQNFVQSQCGECKADICMGKLCFNAGCCSTCALELEAAARNTFCRSRELMSASLLFHNHVTQVHHTLLTLLMWDLCVQTCMYSICSACVSPCHVTRGPFCTLPHVYTGIQVYYVVLPYSLQQNLANWNQASNLIVRNTLWRNTQHALHLPQCLPLDPS